ncbi:MAG: hypothetical protein K5639_00945 [Eubacterium sp.]|nr:hypothetical protein [Eubacterium sp.]
MKKTSERIIKRAIAVFMAAAMMSITPLSDIRPTESEAASSNGKGKYISEIKLAMGANEKEALGEAGEMMRDGYDFLMDESTEEIKKQEIPADLNKDAGTNSLLKEGPKSRVVYLGYKRTDDPSQAITDMAVMNMNGGFSIDDYNALMEKQMNTKIKPFLDNFVEALKEYRINLGKSQSSNKYIRANYIKQMLNKLTDDDTGTPMGDLLENKTKYEIGDVEYNKLSDTQKKKTADILTILMQSNGQATLAIETLITKAADADKKGYTWIDRLDGMTYEDMQDMMAEEHEDDGYGPSDIERELDKLYQNDAKRLIGDKDDNNRYMRWDGFAEKAREYKSIKNEISKEIKSASNSIEKVAKEGELLIGMQVKSESDAEKILNCLEKRNKARDEATQVSLDLQTIAICEYLDTIEYGEKGKTLLDFFKQDSSDVSSGDGLRALYPIVDALSAGQLAGLDFLTMFDLFSVAMADTDFEIDGEEYDGKGIFEEAYNTVKDAKPASIYENVNRDIFEPGAVGLTSKELRDKAKSTDIAPDDGFKLSTLSTVFWGVTAGIALATAVTAGVYARYAVGVLKSFDPQILVQVSNSVYEVKSANDVFGNALIRVAGGDQVFAEDFALTGKNSVTLCPTKLFTALTVGAVVLTVVAIAVSAAMAIADATAYYKVDFAPIPKFMVDEAAITDSKGNVIKNFTAYYKVAECTRWANENSSKTEKKNLEVLGTNGDLNGDVGKEWLALYTVKCPDGYPILADGLLYQINGNGVPSGYGTGIHEFGVEGKAAACNLNNKKYVFNNKAPEIKVFYKNDTKPVTDLLKASEKNEGDTGSLFSRGPIVLVGSIFVLLCLAFVMWLVLRKKNVSE